MDTKKISFALVLLVHCFGYVLPMNKILTKKEAFMQFKNTGSCGGCDLRGQDLRTIFKDLRNTKRDHIIDLSNAYLDRANISGIIADNVNFSGASLRDVIANDARLIKANFTDACLHRINLHNALLFKAIFKRAHCGGANFSQADLGWTDFEEALLEPSQSQVYGPANLGSFYRAEAQHANFKNSKWGCFEMTEANFRYADFTGATKWFGVNFNDAFMADAIGVQGNNND